MSMRDKEVLNMQLVLIPILAKAWKKTYSELSDLLKKYDVLSYIDVCYEAYNSTGNQGIIDDLQDGECAFVFWKNTRKLPDKGIA